MATPFFNDAITTPVDLPSANGRIYGMKLVNTTAAVAYLQVFALPAKNVTLGTTSPIWVVRLQPNESVVWSMPENPAEIMGPPLPSASSPTRGLSVAGTTTPNGATTAAISASILVT